jgi:glycosyltransferase involved in cell wall biosynthesis
MWRPHEPVPQIGRGRRILHVATRFLKGGAERNIAHFVAWEIAAGFDVELAFGPDTETAGIPDSIPTHSLTWLTRNVHPIKDAMAARELRTLLRSRRFDIVHTHLSKAGVVGRFAARGSVTRRVAHTVHMASFGDGYGRLGSWVFRTLERRCARSTDVIAFVGTDLLQLYASAGVVEAAQSMVIHSPIDLAEFLKTREWAADPRDAIRRDFGVDGEAPLFLAIGVLDPRKRYDLMLTGIAPVLARTGAHLAIAGDGRERAKIEVLARELGVAGHVHLLGHVDDVTSLLAAADVLIHTSSVEGVPQVVLQALAAGRPVVATDVTGLREIADAPIRIVPHSGAGLADAVIQALASHPEPVETSALTPWTCAAIDKLIADFHVRIGGAGVAA